ncbi:MAG TPA: oxidoreductase-like domain-containing protein [Pseudoxanthomonas sp.]|nr:oxidoreductase-like domain-containing protein [Pseudoxanthomonas sp.]
MTAVPAPPPGPAAGDDPPPQPPEKPLPGECCESGCPICVYDLYAEALEEYRRALAAWRQRHPDAAPPAG